jgi:hypothetical protein
VSATCGFRFEIFTDEAAIVFVCANRVGCDGEPHRATVDDGGGFVAVIRFSATKDSRNDRRRT